MLRPKTKTLFTKWHSRIFRKTLTLQKKSTRDEILSFNEKQNLPLSLNNLIQP